ncbi:hypothetical protein PR048_031844 [Dryococelus australis]|uniref:Uncharacterized protein n=1 Tax=Dryococelus australis TaxID=614101 RepID=A0ABQ9G6F2_9NEOP|nr:hypothetical protein PR048_031844 [Dryococelus australis]
MRVQNESSGSTQRLRICAGKTKLSILNNKTSDPTESLRIGTKMNTKIIGWCRRMMRNGSSLRRLTSLVLCLPSATCLDDGSKLRRKLILEWSKKVWNLRPGVMLRKRGMIKELNADLVVIPGRMTSQLQVLDVAVNKTFKDKLHQQYTEWLPREVLCY